MNRRDMLKGVGAIGLGSMIPLGKSSGEVRATRKELTRDQLIRDGVCWLTPQETEGPYYFNPSLVRQDIRTDVDTGTVHTGLQLNMTFTVIDIDCNPIPNVLVDIWHCDKDGVYSGYVQPGGNTVGQDFMRGIQMTDANGQCSFITSYPGWYPGRATHVHFKVRLNSTTYVTSQYAFPDSVNNAVYVTPLYVARGPNPTTNASDGIFQNANPQYQVMAATPNATTGGYDGTYTIGVSGATGVDEPVPEIPGEFSLKQNFPNPFNPSTMIGYNLPVQTHVKLVVYDVLGRLVATLVDGEQSAGPHEVPFDGSALNSGFYFYRLTAGSFVHTREMLLLK
ncbi:MAG: T9SS type A sorting domain-containing protein [Bacteroidota bacterium]